MSNDSGYKLVLSTGALNTQAYNAFSGKSARDATSTGVLDGASLDALVTSIAQSVRRTTASARSKIDSMRTAIISGASAAKVEDVGSILVNAKDSQEDGLYLVNRSIFFALTPDKDESDSASKQRFLRKTLNATFNLLGERDDTAERRVKKWINVAEFSEIFEQNEGDAYSEDYRYAQFRLLNRVTKPQAVALSRDYINVVISEWDGLSSIFGFGSKEEFSAKPDPDKGRGKSIYCVFMYEDDKYVQEFIIIEHKVYLNKDFTFNRDKSTDLIEPPEYLKSWYKVNRTDNESGTEAIVTEDDRPDKSKAIKIEKGKEYLTNNVKEARALLEAEKKLTAQGQGIFDYGHLISAGSIKLAFIVKHFSDFMLKMSGTPAASSEAFNKLNNLLKTLHSVLNVSIKIDSIMESWGLPGVPVEGITAKDMYEYLSNIESIDINTITVLEKVGGIVSVSGTLSRTVDSKILIGVFERRTFNQQVKGQATQAIRNFLIKYLEKQTFEALSEKDILRELAGKAATLTASDSFISAAVKTSLGKSIEAGSSKTRKTTRNVKIKVLDGVKASSDIIPKKISLAKKSTNSNTTSGSKSIRPRNRARKDTGAPAGVPPGNLVDIINRDIQEELLQWMGPQSLVNRTGRFAKSVVAVGQQGNSIMYKYMYNPYQVFSRNKGRAPWNSNPNRDPSLIIKNAMRGVLYRYDRVVAKNATFKEV